ncbi:MAG: efflux RND transporter periplasmic adaptor subunit [Bacteroidales bacterium]|jgi:membrane fusion protein (multidrug efflux system)
MKRTLFILGCLIIVVVILALLRTCVISGKKEYVNLSNTNPIVPVECFITKDTLVNYQLETVGTISANEQVEIVSEINRKITSIFLKEGAYVAKDQLLFKLDDADINAKINKLIIEVKLAEANESREKVLLLKGGISQERYDEVSNLHQTLLAEIEILKVDLAKTEIRAPFAGKIGLRNVSEGTLVNPGLVLANLVDISRVKIDFSIPERYARDIHVGSTISFCTDYLNDNVAAVVEAIEPAVDVRTRTLLVRAVAANGDEKLVAGTSVKVTLTLGQLSKRLYIPTSALIPSIKGYSVFVKREGLAQPMMVKTGVRSRDYIQILEGIKVGDTLVLTNLLRVKKESPLKVTKIN